MKRLLHIFLCVIFFSLSANAIDMHLQQNAKALVSSYYSLLNNFANDPLYSSADVEIKRLFRDGDGEEPVYVDLYAIEGKENTNQGTLNSYLAKIGGLYNRQSIKLTFRYNPSSFEYSEHPFIQYKQSGTQERVIFVSAIKEVSDNTGNIKFKTREEFLIENNKINRIQLLPAEGKTRFKSAIDYYEKKEYNKAFELFKIEAEQQNYESAYWLSIMLLKKQGCSNINHRVRNAMALFWLTKSSNNRYGKAIHLMEILAVNNKPCVDASKPENEGLISDINNKGKYGFINIHGDVIVDYKYNYSRHFSNGLAAVRGDNGLWGYINKTGVLVIPYKFSSASDFDAEGTALVSVNKQQYYIDQKGNTLE